MKVTKSNPTLIGYVSSNKSSTNLLLGSRQSKSIEMLSSTRNLQIMASPVKEELNGQQAITNNSSQSSLSIDSVDYDYQIQKGSQQHLDKAPPPDKVSSKEQDTTEIEEKRASFHQQQQLDELPSFIISYNLHEKKGRSHSAGLLLIRSTENITDASSKYKFPIAGERKKEDDERIGPIMKELSIDDVSIDNNIDQEKSAFIVPLNDNLPEINQKSDVFETADDIPSLVNAITESSSAKVEAAPLKFLKRLNKSLEQLSSSSKYKYPMSISKEDLKTIDHIPQLENQEVSLDSLYGNAEVARNDLFPPKLPVEDGILQSATIPIIQENVLNRSIDAGDEGLLFMKAPLFQDAEERGKDLALPGRAFVKLSKSSDFLFSTDKYKYPTSVGSSNMLHSTGAGDIGDNLDVSLDSLDFAGYIQPGLDNQLDSSNIHIEIDPQSQIAEEVVEEMPIASVKVDERVDTEGNSVRLPLSGLKFVKLYKSSDFLSSSASKYQNPLSKSSQNIAATTSHQDMAQGDNQVSLDNIDDEVALLVEEAVKIDLVLTTVETDHHDSAHLAITKDEISGHEIHPPEENMFLIPAGGKRVETDLPGLQFLKLSKSTELLSSTKKYKYPSSLSVSYTNPDENSIERQLSLDSNSIDESNRLIVTLPNDRDSTLPPAYPPQEKFSDAPIVEFDRPISPPLEFNLSSSAAVEDNHSTMAFTVPPMKLSKSTELLISTDKYRFPASLSKINLAKENSTSSMANLEISLDSLHDEQPPEQLNNIMTQENADTVPSVENNERELVASLNGPFIIPSLVSNQSQQPTTLEDDEHYITIPLSDQVLTSMPGLQFARLSKSSEYLLAVGKAKYQYPLSLSNSNLSNAKNSDIQRVREDSSDSLDGKEEVFIEEKQPQSAIVAHHEAALLPLIVSLYTEPQVETILSKKHNESIKEEIAVESAPNRSNTKQNEMNNHRVFTEEIATRISTVSQNKMLSATSPYDFKLSDLLPGRIDSFASLLENLQVNKTQEFIESNQRVEVFALMIDFRLLNRHLRYLCSCLELPLMLHNQIPFLLYHLKTN